MAGVGKARSGSRRGRNRPGTGVIWSRERARKLSKGATGGRARPWAVTFQVKRDVAYDLDMRGAVAHVSVGLARYFRDQLVKGERPDGFSHQHKVSPRTKKVGHRLGDWMGYRDGTMAKLWQIGRLTGTAFRAARTLKPYGGSAGRPPSEPTGLGPGRDKLLNIMLKRGVDFQSVRGKARKEIWRLFDEWLRTTIGPNPGMGRPNTRAGLLPDFEGEG